MPVARFEMPDGRIGRFEVPEGTTPEQAQSLIQQHLGDQKEPGFSERVGQRLEQREQNRQDIVGARQRGEQGYIESGFQQAGNAAGLLNDVAGEAISAVVPDFIEKPVGRAVSNVVNTVGRLPSLGGGTIGERIPQELNQLAENNPRAARNLGAAGNLGALVSAGGIAKGSAPALASVAKEGVRVSAPVVKRAGQEVAKAGQGAVEKATPKNLIAGFKARDVEALEQAGQTIKQRSQSAYQTMRESGAAFKPETTGKIVDKMTSALKEDGILNPRLHDKVIGLMDDFTRQIADEGITLEGLDQWRQLFGEVAGNFGDKVNARKAAIVRNALDEAVDSIDEKDLFLGGKDAVDSLKIARGEWKRQAKFNAITEIVKKSDGDANYLKRELKKFADNPKKTRGWSKEELSALKEASSLSTGEGVLKMLGKFGFDLGNSRIGSGVGALVGGGVGYGVGGGGIGLAVPAAGTAARVGQKAIARGKAENLLRTIEGENPLLGLR